MSVRVCLCVCNAALEQPCSRPRSTPLLPSFALQIFHQSWKALDELEAGLCDELTYKEVQVMLLITERECVCVCARARPKNVLRVFTHANTVSTPILCLRFGRIFEGKLSRRLSTACQRQILDSLPAVCVCVRVRVRVRVCVRVRLSQIY